MPSVDTVDSGHEFACGYAESHAEAEEHFERWAELVVFESGDRDGMQFGAERKLLLRKFLLLSKPSQFLAKHDSRRYGGPR